MLGSGDNIIWLSHELPDGEIFEITKLNMLCQQKIIIIKQVYADLLPKFWKKFWLVLMKVDYGICNVVEKQIETYSKCESGRNSDVSIQKGEKAIECHYLLRQGLYTVDDSTHAPGGRCLRNSVLGRERACWGHVLVRLIHKVFRNDRKHLNSTENRLWSCSCTCNLFL